MTFREAVKLLRDVLAMQPVGPATRKACDDALAVIEATYVEPADDVEPFTDAEIAELCQVRECSRGVAPTANLVGIAKKSE